MNVDEQAPLVVVDTNTFIAAGFSRRSASARIVEAVRAGKLCMVWNEATRGETRYIAEKIPPIRWGEFAGLFRDENRYDGETDERAFSHVPDRSDRKFAALAAATAATLITQDDHLLGNRAQADVDIATPREFLDRFGEGAD